MDLMKLKYTSSAYSTFKQGRTYYNTRIYCACFGALLFWRVPYMKQTHSEWQNSEQTSVLVSTSDYNSLE